MLEMPILFLRFVVGQSSVISAPAGEPSQLAGPRATRSIAEPSQLSPAAIEAGRSGKLISKMCPPCVVHV